MEKASDGELSPCLGWGLPIALGAIGTMDILLNIGLEWHKLGQAQNATALALILCSLWYRGSCIVNLRRGKPMPLWMVVVLAYSLVMLTLITFADH
jgi:hypothetical protein